MKNTENKIELIKKALEAQQAITDNSLEYEEWRIIPESKNSLGVYALCSNKGRIITAKGKLSKVSINNSGYLSVSLFNKGVYKSTTVQRVVAYTFGLISELSYDGTYDINFRNGNKKDCRVENLQVLSHADNISKRQSTGKGYSKSVDAYDKHGKYIRSFFSAAQASRYFGVKASNICMCCKGLIPHTGGFIFRYAI